MYLDELRKAHASCLHSSKLIRGKAENYSIQLHLNSKNHSNSFNLRNNPHFVVDKPREILQHKMTPLWCKMTPLFSAIRSSSLLPGFFHTSNNMILLSISWAMFTGRISNRSWKELELIGYLSVAARVLVEIRLLMGRWIVGISSGLQCRFPRSRDSSLTLHGNLWKPNLITTVSPQKTLILSLKILVSPSLLNIRSSTSSLLSSSQSDRSSAPILKFFSHPPLLNLCSPPLHPALLQYYPNCSPTRLPWLAISTHFTHHGPLHLFCLHKYCVSQWYDSILFFFFVIVLSMFSCFFELSDCFSLLWTAKSRNREFNLLSISTFYILEASEEAKWPLVYSTSHTSNDAILVSSCIIIFYLSTSFNSKSQLHHVALLCLQIEILKNVLMVKIFWTYFLPIELLNGNLSASLLALNLLPGCGFKPPPSWIVGSIPKVLGIQLRGFVTHSELCPLKYITMALSLVFSRWLMVSAIVIPGSVSFPMQLKLWIKPLNLASLSNWPIYFQDTVDYNILAKSSHGLYMSEISFLIITAKKIAQLPAVDMQHSPAKLTSKLHKFAYVDVLTQSMCRLHSDCASKIASWESLHVNFRQLVQQATHPFFLHDPQGIAPLVRVGRRTNSKLIFGSFLITIKSIQKNKYFDRGKQKIKNKTKMYIYQKQSPI
ncbi:hypothetical protein VP01_386g4 [Puccinia sorghi]|uniref:Uncharacterized protein n=1 Tax=Puccinia sorghi TaxID=27349 RepID=A0A0L6UUW5_9BASI|nr:hypothetical protein VP01_386g4 [Puccinia sorghi]